MIVPDACPDILRIVDTAGMVCVKDKGTQEGRTEITGTARCSVLYLPDGESGLRRIEANIPFFCTADGPGVTPGCSVVAVPRVQTADTRVINPRKVVVRVNLAIDLRVYSKAENSLCSGAEWESGMVVEQLKEVQDTYTPVCVQEKPFTFSDELTISGSRPEAEELLKYRPDLVCSESKIIGNKLIFKGEAVLHLCYRSGDGALCTVDYELPFSQIMEVEGAPEGAEPTVRLQLTGADLQVDGGDAEGREIAVTLYLHATALLHQTQELTLLSDLYSTAYDLTYDAAPLELTSFRQQFTRRQTVREVLEIGVVADSILSLSVTCGAVSVSREGETAVLRTGADLRALYLDEGGVPLVAERTIDVSCQLELPEDCRITARAGCPEEAQGGLTDRGIEVRFPVDFQGAAAQQVKRVCVSGGKLSTDAPKDTAGAPSLVLRCLGKQETAWDLAKRYNTTIGVILSANQVESEGEIPRDQLLLIPRKRA